MKALLLLLAASLAKVVMAQAPIATGSYQFSPEFPKYVTAHVEVRDPSGARWPSFFYGKPASAGRIEVSGEKPTASFTLKCDQRPQKQGDQSRRVFGEIFDSPAKVGIILQVNEAGQMTHGASGKKDEWQTTFSGFLDVAGRKIAFQAPGTLRAHEGGRGDEKNESLMGELVFKTTASALGLKTFAPEAPIHIRAAFTAYAQGAGTRRAPASR